MLDRVRWRYIILFCLFPFLGWWTYGLFDLDEGFYGSIAAEMNQRGEWILPTLHGNPWFEKPILIYWFAKPSIAAFGTMVGPRVPSILASLVCLVAVGSFAQKFLNAGKLATLCLASSLLFIATGRMILTDPLLNLFLCLSLFAFWSSIQTESSNIWRAVSLASLGFAVLAKGPVAIILFSVVAIITYARMPHLRPGFKGGWLGGVLALGAVVSLWYVPIYLRDPNGFVSEFLIKQNLMRFAGGDEAHNLGTGSLGAKLGNLFTYIPVLLLSCLAWSYWIVPALRNKEKSDTQRFLAIWGLTIFLFFSISGTKLPHYILPCLPPLAILVASSPKRPHPGLVATFVSVFGAIAIFGSPFYYKYSGQAEQLVIMNSIRKEEGSVVCYQLPRREKELGTGKLKVRETSLPSTGLYAIPKPWNEFENLEQAMSMKQPVFILTRPRRLTTKDRLDWANKGWRLTPINVPLAGDHYELYRFERRVPQ